MGFFEKDGRMRFGSRWEVEHWRGNQLLQTIETGNLVVDEGIAYILDVGLSGGSQETDWYLALMDADHTPAGDDTYANSMGTANYESTDYDEATRPAWVEAGVSANSISNNASPANFTMGGTDTTIYGAGLVSSSTKGDTTATEKLLLLSRFSTALSGISDDDVIKIKVTVSGDTP